MNEEPSEINPPPNPGREWILAPALAPTLTDRLHHALGSVLGGIILDLTDLATWGPIGLVFGLLIGTPVGYWIATIYGFSKSSRWFIAALAGIYCAVPFTEFIPLATMVAAVARFHSAPHRIDAVSDDASNQTNASSG